MSPENVHLWVLKQSSFILLELLLIAREQLTVVNTRLMVDDPHID
jgi:hypothetical protein